MEHAEAVDGSDFEEIGHAHWSVFLPTVVIAVAVTCLWGALEVAGRGEGLPARFAFLVGAVAIPLLTLVSFLRFQTVRVLRSGDRLSIETGWPSTTPKEIGRDEIADVSASAGALGARFGSGRVTVRLRDGRTLRLADIADPHAVAARMTA